METINTKNTELRERVEKAKASNSEFIRRMGEFTEKIMRINKKWEE